MKKLTFISDKSMEATRLQTLLSSAYELTTCYMKYADAHDSIQNHQPDVVVLYVDGITPGVLEMSRLFKRIAFKFPVLVLSEEASYAQCSRYFPGNTFTRVKMPEPDNVLLQLCSTSIDPFRFEEKGFYQKYLSADRRLRVLIIDHSLLWLQTASEFLSLQYDVDSTPNGRKAMDKALRNSPDIILIDLELKDMDGKELFMNFRMIPRFKNTPILFTSSNTSGGKWMLDAFALRPAAIIQKPVTREELVRFVDDAYLNSMDAVEGL